ncbi:MAG TPA: PAS domain-containing protein, partial [Salegentibacter sp.]|nr:PAS domain-containing protein [Salegentibacter sp.]
MAREFFKENHSVFNTLFEAASEGVIVVDSKQIIVTVNLAAHEMFGYERGELVGEHLNILIPPNYKPDHSKHFKDFL